jgi:hypothetical protein
MIPHMLVLKPGLILHSIYNGCWFWGRPSFVDLWHDLRAVTHDIRPDWDLSTLSATPGTTVVSRHSMAGTRSSRRERLIPRPSSLRP